LPNRNPNKNQS